MQGALSTKETEGTYRSSLEVAMNSRTVYQRNKHFLLWDKNKIKNNVTMV